ncbi:Gfo/Idh/MocA family protein [Paracoccus salsus]|uniref:Gfo/Idh/MocA family protein n=1 Tax=Paracoccus salsus TaxID=2911061 RepID=UPI001F3F79A8|nr:Gfo/Idh/MocA family oxidoreductase [Paracoccus salsus]MCF3972117.1 Gfo/Idh/MocA family oxidoreductase [Paracoccus salsus]
MEPIRLGMVGGGQGSFIGAVHRIAARMDGHFRLVAGALASDPGRARDSAAELGLEPGRSYGHFAEMAEAESSRADGIQAVSIVAPNHVHAPAAIEFLRRGIHVICDKPLTATLDEAEALVAVAQTSRARFILTHNYTGYPLVRQAREMVTQGKIGTLRLVQVEYLQDWLTDAVESQGVKQAEWRSDPARAGLGGALGDIGTHAHNLAGFVTGLAVESLAADIQSFVPGRRLDDNAHVLLRYPGGVRGTLLCSQIAPGRENGLAIRIFGDAGGLEWHQQRPDALWYSPYGQPTQVLTRMGPGTGQTAAAASRVPAGHPEGYLEAFANIYADAAAALRTGVSPALLPGLEDGVAGMRFVAACVTSSRQNSAWVTP